jgi:hypothetical protein
MVTIWALADHDVYGITTSPDFGSLFLKGLTIDTIKLDECIDKFNSTQSRQLKIFQGGLLQRRRRLSHLLVPGVDFITAHFGRKMSRQIFKKFGWPMPYFSI